MFPTWPIFWHTKKLKEILGRLLTSAYVSKRVISKRIDHNISRVGNTVRNV